MKWIKEGKCQCCGADSGEYKGIFPCADCEGIETELELNPNNRYELKETYLGKGKENESKVKGTFSFDTNNPALISLDAAGDNRKFFIGEIAGNDFIDRVQPFHVCFVH